tara:strand:- start:367 stop:564 length:198 start_codon:yes stop_codon:yes gene_type:complete
MGRYTLRQYDGHDAVPVTDTIELSNDDDARDMARVALLATPAWTHIDVYHANALIGSFQRDRGPD